MAPTKPSLELLRSLSDEHVLRALMTQRQATRAEIAAVTGLSKPTVSESVRRLDAAGAVVDTGARTTGRGRIGTYYALPESTGCALVVSIAPEGIVAVKIDVYGEVVREARAAVAGPTDRVAAQAGSVAKLLAEVAREATRGAGPVRVAVVSAADPVDRRTGRLVELPDAPFLVGALDAPAVLAPYVDGPVTVDNDVNWAARAEHRAETRDFVYVYLGEGVGCAVVSDGEVRRGHTGVAGEIAHVLTVGPNGTAMPLTEVFAALGLRREGSTAIDVPALLDAIEWSPNVALQRSVTTPVLDVLARAVAGVLSAAVALADPAVVLLGGPWGAHPRVVAAVAHEFASAPRHVPVAAATSGPAPAGGDAATAATGTTSPALAGAREAALDRLRDTIVAASARIDD